MGLKEERERASKVMLHMEERYKQVDEKITNFDSFPVEIKDMLEEYVDVFDTKLKKIMNVDPVKLNMREGQCHMRPTPAGQHLRTSRMKQQSW